MNKANFTANMEVNNDNNQFSTIANNLCITCLSSNRKLFKLRKLKITLMKLVFDFRLVSMVDNLVCWECLAMLKKISKFTSQATSAYITLSSRKGQTPRHNYICFSNLSKTEHEHIDIDPEPKPTEDSSQEFQYEVLIDNTIKTEGDTITEINFLPNFSYQEDNNVHIQSFSHETVLSTNAVEGDCHGLSHIKQEFNDAIDTIDEFEQRYCQDSFKQVNEMETISKAEQQSDMNYTITTDPIFVPDPDNQTIYPRSPNPLTENENNCQQCKKVFKTATALQKHVRSAHNVKRKLKNMECLICGKGFTTTRLLREHENKHPEARPRVCTCNLCGDTYRSILALKRHMKASHPQENPTNNDGNLQNSSFQLMENADTNEMSILGTSHVVETTVHQI